MPKSKVGDIPFKIIVSVSQPYPRGRDKFLSHDHKTFNLPVPIGTTVYQVNTCCGDFCSTERERFDVSLPRTIVGRCSNKLPCQTVIGNITSVEMTTWNVMALLDEWGNRCFATEAEAIHRMEEIIGNNRDFMRSKGFTMTEDGHGIIPKEDTND